MAFGLKHSKWVKGQADDSFGKKKKKVLVAQTLRPEFGYLVSHVNVGRVCDPSAKTGDLQIWAN